MRTLHAWPRCAGEPLAGQRGVPRTRYTRHDSNRAIWEDTRGVASPCEPLRRAGQGDAGTYQVHSRASETMVEHGQPRRPHALVGVVKEATKPSGPPRPPEHTGQL